MTPTSELKRSPVLEPLAPVTRLPKYVENKENFFFVANLTFVLPVLFAVYPESCRQLLLACAATSARVFGPSPGKLEFGC